MPLIKCPECSKEISSAANMCPDCGHPMNTVSDNPVVATPQERQEPFPKWIIAPIAIIGALLLFFLFYMLQNNDANANDNLNVNVSSETQASDTQQASNTPPFDPSSGTTTTGSDQTTSTGLEDPENNQTISADTQLEEGGLVEINAKVADPKGNVTPVKAEKFYLLDKELSQILRDAKLRPIGNQNLVNSFGLSVLDPGKYGEFNKKALDAINEHIKYDALTDSAGVARIGNIKPDSYYIFGIHKVGNGFAVWSSPVAIKPGKNNLNIQPEKMREGSNQ